MMKYLLLFSSVCFPFLLAGQDFKAVLTAMQQHDKDVNKLHVVMEIKVYEKEGTQKPFFNEAAVVRSEGLNYSYQYGEVEMIMNERCLLMIDHAAKEILYRTRDAKTELPDKGRYHFDLDSMLTFYDTPQYLGKKNDTDHYRLVQKEGEIRQIDFYVHPESLLIDQLTYRYRQGQFVSIGFLKFDKAPVFAAGQFDEHRIINRSKGKVITTGSFAHYKISTADEDQTSK